MYFHAFNSRNLYYYCICRSACGCVGATRLTFVLEINVALISVDFSSFYLIDEKGDPAISFN